MPGIVESIHEEFLRYRSLAEGAMRQLEEKQLSEPGPDGSNSIATICWHISGNLRSRFTDFLTSDGEKPWRHRDEEFDSRRVTRDELLGNWQEGWAVLVSSLEHLRDDQLGETVTIRRQPLVVHAALHRSLAHIAYHVGQIVYIAKALRGEAWTSLSIPRGQSDAYLRNPDREKPAAHASSLRGKDNDDRK
jgi:hypothetical protein